MMHKRTRTAIGIIFIAAGVLLFLAVCFAVEWLLDAFVITDNVTGGLLWWSSLFCISMGGYLISRKGSVLRRLFRIALIVTIICLAVCILVIATS